MDYHDHLMRVFGKQLRYYRRRAGFKSGASFAREMGILPVTYATYERGHAEPNYATLMRMCDRLGVTPNDLFFALPDQKQVG